MRKIPVNPFENVEEIPEFKTPAEDIGRLQEMISSAMDFRKSMTNFKPVLNLQK
jgi:hypothetical protein